MIRSYFFIKRSIAAFALVVITLQAAVFAQAVGTDLTAQAALVTEFDVNGLKVLVKRRRMRESKILCLLRQRRAALASHA